MTFTVYENRLNNYASIHREGCSHIRQHGGESSVDPPTGCYHDEIGTFLEALRIALNSGKRNLALCSRCFLGGVQLRNWQPMNSTS